MSLESEEPATRAGLLHQRGLTLGSLGRRDEALSNWYEALDLYEALGQDEAAADVSLVAAFFAGWAARLDEAAELARRGLRAIGGRSSSRRCDLLARLGQVLIVAGNSAEGDRCLTEAVEHARSLGVDPLLGRVLSARTQRSLVLELRETVQDGAEAAALLRGTGDTLNLCQGLYCSQYSLLFLGQIGDAAARAAELEPLVRRFGHDFHRVFGDLFFALGEVVVHGDVERCQARIAAAVDGASLVGWEFIARGQLAWVHFWRGHWPESSDEAERAAQLEVLGAWNGTGWGPLVAVSAYRGDRERALAIMRDQHQLLPARGQPITLGSSGVRVVAVEALAVLGMKDEAAQLYPAVQEILARGMIFSFSLGLVQRAAGIASACAGEWDTAEGHFETALRQAHEIPHKIEQPEVRRWYAWMLLERRAPGDIGKARQLLGEAIEMYRTIGMPKHVELAEALLARA